MTEETRNKLNAVLTHSFLLNMICDNAVYEIAANVYPNISEIVHADFAHHWPVVADEWSDLMLSLDEHPVRGNLVAEYINHDGDLEAIFADIYDAVEAYRQDVAALVTIAEYNDDAEVKIVGEEILRGIMPYRKQAKDWATMAKRYNNDYKAFDARFDKLTTVIPKGGAK